jgi:flagellar hook protein FlgE
MTYFSIFAPSSAALRGHAQALSTIGMNIVNQTTQGFKQSDTRFVSEFNSRTDSVYPSYGGIRPKPQNFIDKQGAVLSTTRELDITISGRGFFVVNPKFDLSGVTLLTRSGSMQKVAFDNNGTNESYLADTAGNFLFGWPADGAGGFTIGTGVGSLSPMRVHPSAFPINAVATTSVTFSANLPAGASPGDSFNSGVSVFDQNSTSQQLNLVITRQPTLNQWEIAYSLPDGTVTAGSPFTLNFDASGAVVAPATATTDITWTDVTAGTSSVAFDFSNTKRFGGSFTPFSIVTDGAGDGSFGR